MKTATSLRQKLLNTVSGAAGAVFALAGAALATAALLLPGTAGAATTQSFQISPPTANYTGDHGTIQTGTIKVTNLTNTPMSVKVGKQNFVAKGEEGEIELTDNADPLYSLAPWFTFDAPQLDLPALGTKEVHYTIAIPAEAEPGGRYGSVTFSTIPPKLPSGQSGAAVQQTLAGIAFVRINGKANEQLEVASFEPGKVGPQNQWSSKSFFEYGPVEFLTRLKNTGTVHEKATGTITFKNLLGMKVGSVPLDEHFVIPGAVRRLHNQWPTAKKKPFLIGKYTATLDAKYDDGQKLTASTSFVVLPWKQVAIAFIILLLIVLFVWKGRKRFGRAFRILAGKE